MTNTLPDRENEGNIVDPASMNVRKIVLLAQSGQKDDHRVALFRYSVF